MQVERRHHASAVSGAARRKELLHHLGRSEPKDAEDRDPERALVPDLSDGVVDRAAVSAVAVEEDDPFEALPHEAVDVVFEDRPKRRRPQTDRSRIGLEVLGVASRDDGRDDRAGPFRGGDRDRLRDDEVAHRRVGAVLLLRSERHDHRHTCLQLLLGLDPGEVLEPNLVHRRPSYRYWLFG